MRWSRRWRRARGRRGEPGGEGHGAVAAGDVPTSIDQIFNCPVCNAILAAHFPNGFNNPPVPVLNAGGAGLDAVGDSLLLAPGGSVSDSITAAPGSKLHYLCAIHPWMQGTITVH